MSGHTKAAPLMTSRYPRLHVFQSAIEQQRKRVRAVSPLSGKEYGEETTQKNFIGASSARVTFVAIADGIEVDVELLVADEEQTEPGVEGVHRHDEEDADDVALLVGDGVGPEVRVDLE